jgi:hypothetical protein
LRAPDRDRRVGEGCAAERGGQRDHRPERRVGRVAAVVELREERLDDDTTL